MPRWDSRRAADICATVATSGRPSGTAATATLTPEAIAARSDWRRSSASPVMTAPPSRVIGRPRRVSSSNRVCIPAGPGPVAANATARPASVAEPTATTAARPDPPRTVVPS